MTARAAEGRDKTLSKKDALPKCIDTYQPFVEVLGANPGCLCFNAETRKWSFSIMAGSLDNANQNEGGDEVGKICWSVFIKKPFNNKNKLFNLSLCMCFRKKTVILRSDNFLA